MEFEIVKQDLMTVSPKYVLCHCISTDCAMGAGVVVPIKKKYNGIKSACQQFAGITQTNSASQSNSSILGKAFRFECDAGTVYNLFSKERYKHKAGKGISEKAYLCNLRSALAHTKTQMLANNESYLAMPKIACGLDQCKWVDVEAIIKEVFVDTDIEIVVCVL